MSFTYYIHFFVHGKRKKWHRAAFSTCVVTIYSRAKLSTTRPRSHVSEQLNIKNLGVLLHRLDHWSGRSKASYLIRSMLSALHFV